MNDYSPIADLYDAYVTDGRDLEFWRRWSGSAAGPILELTAGTGRATTALVQGAFPVTCLDLSLPMLRHLARRFAAAGRRPRPVCADLCRLPFSPRSFGLVAVPFHSFSEVVDPAARRHALHEMRRVLRPQGRLVLTLHNPRQRRRTLDGKERLLGPYAVEGGTLEVRVRGFAETGNLARSEQTYRVFGPTGTLRSEQHATVHFALIEEKELLSLARAAGLELLEQTGDYDGSPYDPATSPFHLTVFRSSGS